MHSLSLFLLVSLAGLVAGLQTTFNYETVKYLTGLQLEEGKYYVFKQTWPNPPSISDIPDEDGIPEVWRAQKRLGFKHSAVVAGVVVNQGGALDFQGRIFDVKADGQPGAKVLQQRVRKYEANRSDVKMVYKGKTSEKKYEGLEAKGGQWVAKHSKYHFSKNNCDHYVEYLWREAR